MKMAAARELYFITIGEWTSNPFDKDNVLVSKIAGAGDRRLQQRATRFLGWAAQLALVGDTDGRTVV